MGSLVRSPKLAKFGAARGDRYSELDPMSSGGATGAESGGKGRYIRRPFHLGCLASP
jgi:hypothetical protein